MNLSDIFINCPFDKEYQPLLRALLFGSMFFGYTPKIALDDSDCSTNRLDKIFNYIRGTDISIHDLSRAKPNKKGDYARMNMPFELGMDYAISKSRSASKLILVLEAERYSFQKALSDYSGFDIYCHKNDPQELLKILRNWLVNQRLVSSAIGASALWYRYNDCWASIYDELISNGYSHDDTDDIPFNEFTEMLEKWCQANR